MARMKKLYYIKREVIASTLHEALRAKGMVYEAVLADEKNWPDNKPKIGYGEKKDIN